MLYILHVYVTKWTSTDCVVSLFIILLGTYFYVLWILKIVLITSPWNVLNGMIIFIAFDYCIYLFVCVCVCIHHAYVLSKLKMKRIQDELWEAMWKNQMEKQLNWCVTKGYYVYVIELFDIVLPKRIRKELRIRKEYRENTIVNLVN